MTTKRTERLKELISKSPIYTICHNLAEDIKTTEHTIKEMDKILKRLTPFKNGN